MDNNQNNNEPVLQPMDENVQVNNTVQPEIQPDNSVNTNNNQNNEDIALHTRMIQDQKANPQINLAAYEKSKEKKEKEVKTFTEDPHAGVKRFFGFLLVILLLAFAIFLPTISEKLSEWKNQKDNEALINGHLRCSMTKNTDTLKVEYSQNFKFANSRIINYKYEESSTGSTQDTKELEAIDHACRDLDQKTSSVVGLTITCSITSTNATVVQEFNLDTMDMASMKAAIAEAGGTYPEFSAGENVDTVQSKVQSAGYKCEKMP